MYKRMFAMDANFSLKRMAAGTRREGDMRMFMGSDYYLRDDEIQRYENEVKQHARGPPVPTTPGAGFDDGGDEEGDPTDGSVETHKDGCADRWKAAAADEKKKMWHVFHESGIFATACRHGLIMWIANLIQSGEL